ncbi:MAG: glycosyltransferase family 2 protein [Bacteroidota bacterium]|nr:glycosyltransferase family 2 protein [Bacteroidota bacterium]
MKISSIIIAKNEELNIARCIESQLECVDEIVVLVGNESTDRTLEIVNSYEKVKCETVEWMGYAKTKQYAVTLTTNNWVLWIDADECLSKNLIEEIKKFKDKTPDNEVYSFPRKAEFLGRWILHGGWYPGRVERLFDKTRVRFSESDVHEYLSYTGRQGYFTNDIEHYTDPNIKHYLKKLNNYTSLAANELLSKKKVFKLSDIIIRPLWLFVKMYFIKAGFLDGLQGFILASFSSFYVFTKYCKLWELKK